MVKIADYFDVSIDYLLGRTHEPKRQASAVDELGLSAQTIRDLIWYKEYSSSNNKSVYETISSFLEETLHSDFAFFTTLDEIVQQANRLKSFRPTKSDFPEIYIAGKNKGVCYNLLSELECNHSDIAGLFTVVYGKEYIDMSIEHLCNHVRRCAKKICEYDKL